MRRYWAIVVFLLAAVFLIVLGIVYFITTLNRSQPPEPLPAAAPATPVTETPQTRRVLIATRYLSVGTLLEEADVVPDAMEIGQVPAGAIPVSDRDDILGAAVRAPLDAGTPLVDTDLVHPGARGFLSLILAPGMRAVSVNVGPAVRFSGLVDPGDRVDVIFTASAPSSSDLLSVGDLPPSVSGDRLTRTVFENLRVLAIDRTLRPPAIGGEKAPKQRSEFATATLEVTPEQAPALIHATREGQLALVVRAALPAPVPSSAPSAVHIQELLLPNAPRVSPPKADPSVVRIFRADSTSEVVFPDIGPPREVRTPIGFSFSPAPLPSSEEPS